MTMQVKVVSTTEVLWTGEATTVSVPSVEGDIGILTGRQPVLAVLKAGTVRITPTSGQRVTLPVQQGFISVDEDAVTVVVDNTEDAQPLLPQQ